MKLSVLSRMLMVTNPCLRWVMMPPRDWQFFIIQGECDGELWRWEWRAGLESGRPASTVGSPIPDAWTLLGLSFKWAANFISKYQIMAFPFWLPLTCASNPLLLLTARNVYDLTGDNLRLEVEVVDPIVDNMGMEVKHFIISFKQQGHYKLDQPMFPFWSNKLANII